MKTMTYITFALLLILICGAFLWWGIERRDANYKPEPVDTAYIKYAGFTQIENTGRWIKRTSNCISVYFILSPAYDEKTRKNTWLLSTSNDFRTRVNLDCITNTEDLNEWIKIMQSGR